MWRILKDWLGKECNSEKRLGSRKIFDNKFVYIAPISASADSCGRGLSFLRRTARWLLLPRLRYMNACLIAKQKDIRSASYDEASPPM